MKIDDLDTSINEDNFMERIVLPGHYPLAKFNAARFCIRNLQEQIMICSNDYAYEIGYTTFQKAQGKQPDVDYERITGTQEQFILQMNYLKKHKKSFHFMYKDINSSGFYLTVSEPVLSLSGNVIGKKETDVKLKLFSHREIIENHFGRFKIDIAALENITEFIQLTEKEELILFMLVGGYSQQEIGSFLNLSRSAILKTIAEQLCPKFGLEIVSTKLLIEKAIALGLANFIPARFLNKLNEF